MKRVAIYARVSTHDQTTENQLQELQHVAKSREWEVVDVFRDEGISGAKGRDKRPELNRLMTDATRRQFEMILVWSVDRLGRSLKHLVELMSEIEALGVGLYLHQQALDTTTPSGRALFQMCGVFAEFERSMISERVKAGLLRARGEGKRLGRKPIGADKEKEILELRSREKIGIKKIARQVGVGVSVVQRVLRQRENM